MAQVSRDLVEYNGIECCPFTSNYFKQVNLDYIFCIPKQKPDIEQIVKVWVKTYIVNKQIIKTPVGTSLEGQNITGQKLLVCGDIDLKIEYVGCNLVQSVHTAHTRFPFCSYLVLPADYNSNSIVTVSAAVEDIISEQMDLRCIYNNITMMLVADIC